MTIDQAANDLTAAMHTIPGTDPASADAALDRMIDAANAGVTAAPRHPTPADGIALERIGEPQPALVEMTTQGMNAEQSAHSIATQIRALRDPGDGDTA